MKKIIIWFITGAVVIGLGLIILSYLTNPLRRPEGQIREDILEITPIGTSMEDVIKIIENNKKWEAPRIFNECGVSYADLGWPSKPDDLALGKITVIGEKSIRTIFGRYQAFFQVLVDVHWAFDENAKLIDIFIQKDSISL